MPKVKKTQLGYFDQIRPKIPTAKIIFHEAVSEAIIGLDQDSNTFYSDLLARTMLHAEAVYRKHEVAAFSAVVQQSFPSASSVGEWLGANFYDLEGTFMSLFQSRKSRAGSTLQDAFAVLLELLEIPYQSQQTVEGIVDFVIPTLQVFNDNPLRSRVAACKRTLRERWTEIIPEANNQGVFYLVTIDQDVTSDALLAMRKRRVYLVVPEALRKAKYVNAPNVIGIDEFLHDTIADMQKLGLMQQEDHKK